VLGDMFKSVRNSGRFVLDQGGDHRFNFIYADDVATATLAALAAQNHAQELMHALVSCRFARRRVVGRIFRPGVSAPHKTAMGVDDHRGRRCAPPAVARIHGPGRGQLHVSASLPR
jgi:hypothetical protein